VDSFTLRKIEFDEVRRILSEFSSSALGRSLALRISPSRNPEVVRRWLEQTSQMVRAVRDVSLPPFGGVTDISGPLKRCVPSGGATAEDFATIASTLKGAAEVRKYLAALPEQLDALHELEGGIGDFHGEVKAIESIVAPDATVRDEASERLTNIRHDIAATAQHVHDVIHGYLQDPEVKRLLRDTTVRLHADRYVLPVKADNRGRLPGVVHRASGTGATVFVEPNQCVELNNRLADLRDDERREVRRLLNQLAIRVGARTADITATLRTLAQVDLLSAKAQYAYQFDMVAPEIAENMPLQFSRARHPLLVDQAFRREQAGVPPEKRHPVVPIDLRLGSDFDLLVITGSNTGGKTVTLKTAALLVVMVQSGMHIPVQRGATMPVFRDVFIDVGDEQSLQQSLSTFGAHMKRTKYILDKADRSCLVLLDELGAGTDPEEGGAIGQAVLDELRRMGCVGMVTTHLSVLKAYAYNHERVDNASVEFDTETLSPTYHLHIGTPGESHAITVAKRLGVGKRVVSAARRHLDSQGKQFRRAIRATGVARKHAEAARSGAQEAQLAAQSERETFEAELARLKRLKEDFEGWMASLPELRQGDEVFVPSLKKTGRLVRLELHKQIALVDADSVQVEVPLAELMPDFGQQGLREEIADLRKQILEQARRGEGVRAEAERIRDEYHRSLTQHRQRARQFDTWLGAIARLKVGDVVPIATKPGRAKVVKVELPALRAIVATDRGEIELPIQDLFPQTGPFATRAPRPSAGRRKKPAPRSDRPMRRGRSDPKSRQRNREAVLSVEPGQRVFVVPFNKQATLIRINPDKNNAVVQSGIFEMEIPLSDLEPLRAP